MDEHWKFMIADERQIYTSLRDGEYSKVRSFDHLVMKDIDRMDFRYWRPSEIEVHHLADCYRVS